jgi:hypothetical protein
MSWMVNVCARRAMVVALAVMLGPIAANGQTVVDATAAEFEPSVDHNVTDSGTAVVASYVLQFFPLGGSTPSHTINMGKPDPGVDGLIRFPFTSRLTTPLVPGTTYQASVLAVGPGGTAPSALSNPFTTSTACSPSISATTATISAAAATGNVSVVAGTGCTWTATSNASWLTVTSGASGTAAGSVGYSVTANAATAARTGAISVAGRIFTVTQSGTSACTYAINPASRTSIAAGESTSVSVTSGSDCAWTATSAAAWITVSAGATGTGNATVNMTIAANQAAQRTGTVTIAGHTFTVTQSGVQPCTYAINPASRTSIAAGESTSVTVTSGSGCAWTAASGAGWITVSAGANGTGNGTVSMTIAANPAAAQRTGTVTMAGRTFVVTQQGISCTYSVTPGILSVPPAGVRSTLAIATLPGCTWSASGLPSWVTLATTGQGGPTQLSYTVAPNTGPARSATLTVAGRAVVVNQTSPMPPAPGNVRVVANESQRR